MGELRGRLYRIQETTAPPILRKCENESAENDERLPAILPLFCVQKSYCSVQTPIRSGSMKETIRFERTSILKIGNATLELVQGDITDQQVGAIVNAANAQLSGGSGVNGAIQKRGGPAILTETSERYPNGCPTGSAVITAAGDLLANYVIHAVGPRYQDGQSNEAELLAGAYRASLELATKYARESVAMPALSAGIYGYPLDEAAKIAVGTVHDYLSQHHTPQLVRFVLFDEPAMTAFQQAVKALEAA